MTKVRFQGKTWLAALTAVLVGLAALGIIERFQEEKYRQAERLETLTQLSSIRARLEGGLSAMLLGSRGLVAHIARNPDVPESEISGIANELLAQKSHIRNIAIARGFSVSQIYPLKGNESAIGLNYLERVDQREAVLRAVGTRQSVLAGPVTLVQGGQALIGRSPIFSASAAGESGGGSLWGLVSVVIDIDGVLRDAGAHDPNLPIQVAIRGKDGLGPFGDVFYGDKHLFEREHIPLDVVLPGGRWQMAGVPKPELGEAIRKDIWTTRGLGLFAVLLLGVLSFGIVRYVDQQKVVQAHLQAVIVAQKQVEEQVRHMATHDTLTGLANRTLFTDELRHTLGVARRRGGKIGILFIDLNDFKDVNDTLGHHVGDQLLCVFSERIATLLRESDLFARLGGDEFAIIANDVDSPHGVAIVAQRILDSLSRPLVVEGREIQASASVGITLFPADGQDPETLLQNADMAMYSAKAKRRNSYSFYQPILNQLVKERKSIEDDIRHGLAQGEFHLVYQPRLGTHSERVTGVEALLRWQHPQRGNVAPGTFIEIAEKSGLIIPLGEWAMREACHQIKSWIDSGVRDVPPISVNLSPVQFQRGDPVETVRGALEASGLPPTLLEVEITEGAIMEDVSAATATMEELRSFGISIAIDDFGTGYSSLAYLRHFPVQRMKIDRSFVRTIGHDTSGEAIIDAILSLGRALGLGITAEGVETVEQLAFLRQRECEEVQGFYFARPLLPEDFLDFLERQNAKATAMAE